MQNRITALFGIQYPIVQGGMIWCSGWRLAAAVSEAGGLGLIGAGSMYPEVLREHIQKAAAATRKPFGVNMPLLYPQIEEVMHVLEEENVRIVFTSAGSPAKWTSWLKERGKVVVHVISSSRFARKCEEAGVDAIVAEGFEAGGHNGKDETTTMALIPLVRHHTFLPLIAAGGIASGASMLAAMALGAEGVQVGSRFAAAEESSAHPAFKERIVSSVEGDTMLRMKKLVPVRLLNNAFSEQVRQLEDRGANADELQALLGKARAKKGMFEGDMEEGELEIGQVAAQLGSVQPAAEIIREMMEGYYEALARLKEIRFHHDPG